MASRTEIANMVVSHLGQEVEIDDIDNENSPAARVLRRFEEISLQTTLQSAPWGFATKTVELSLLTDTDDDDHPTDLWAYTYAKPSDCLSVRRILTGYHTDINSTREPFVEVYGDNGSEIWTNVTDAVAEFTKNVTDTARMPADFVLAWSYKWAEMAATKLTGGDPYNLKVKMREMYRMELNTAKARMLNEQQDEAEPNTEYLNSRT